MATISKIPLGVQKKKQKSTVGNAFFIENVSIKSVEKIYPY